ncbi:unnamed protein product [Nezara viridula]|uniref:Uncharacterized protein n=1 Tax=Nezara viridula TaxID=85310 RepID=A0A9P0HB00_NEZVI|nr:unnamed protein product [Nezara viridula]
MRPGTINTQQTPAPQANWGGGALISAPSALSQDSVPAHKARQLSSGCKRTFQSSSLATDWPPGSPDLNPLDYRLWFEL